MLRSLIRVKFIDRVWGREDLELIAEFWLRLYDEAKHLPHQSWKSHQFLELHLTGVPRFATATVSEELARRLFEARVPVRVSTADPDKLVAKTEPREGNHKPLPGLGIHALAGALFDGLLVEIRFTVADEGATEQIPGLVGATLVIVGELRDGTILVKSLWPDPAFVTHETSWAEISEWEDHLLATFNKFRRRKTIRNEDAISLFNLSNEMHQRPSKPFLQRLLYTSFGKPRFPGLLLRLFASVSLVVTWIVLLVLLIVFEAKSDWVFLLCMFAVVFFALAVRILKSEYQWLFTAYTQQREWYADYFQRGRYAALPPDDPRPWRNDPVVRKFTAELVEAGFVHVGDAAAIPTENAGTVHCTFHAPDGVTYLVLAFTFANGTRSERFYTWPASSIILCQTFEETGCRLETINDEHPLATLKREDPTARWLILPKNIHPLDLYRRHVEAVEQWVTEVGATLLPHVMFGEFISRQEAISRQECLVYCVNPYSWRDHLRWYLQLDAKPSSESK